MVVRCLLLVVALPLVALEGKGQTLQLQQCYELAEANYPLVRQRELLERSNEYTVSNVSKGSLPQLGIYGQASYQSDVTKIPISLPGVDVPTLPKDQFRIYGELNQPLTDLVTVKYHKEIQEANAMVQEQNLEVELYKLRERINQLFFGALMLEAQLYQNRLLKTDIEIGIAKISAAIRYGTELSSSRDKLQAELLKVGQREIELEASRMAFIDMLGRFINRQLGENVTLEKPEPLVATGEIDRPELKLFQYQREAIQMQNKLISARTFPKFSLFLQAGFGQPSPVNMLSDEFSSYYLAGVRLNWTLSSFYTSGKERELLTLNQQIIDTQQETFLFNTSLTLRQQNAEITRLQSMIEKDDEIVRLRTSVKEASTVQLENGVITVNDYLREVNAEDQARSAKLLHEMQLLMAYYSLKTTSGAR